MNITRTSKGAESQMLSLMTAILQSGQASTQEDIIFELEKKGILANQSKISRLLRKIGAIKITNEQKQIIYSLPLDPILPNSKQVLSSLIVSITSNEQLIVIHTNPGSASLIARFLDHHRKELELLGPVAGDDTLFIAPKSIKQIKQTVQMIHEFIIKY